ncbi:energy transducer TonB [Flavobacterium sp. AS60]|uniref:energy transducer TonB n=1 Tax=Flavobacterium anseongense TaxID=2910677 RepID=UPI001F15D9A1|nr:energy transducer TonB [Flavobacterium sp. AS60]MCF6128942.1 energy transducer TonB [Flavobacterium sp. AS60]
MSNVSIYEKNWIDLVFEDKNKAYGAYQLRQENPITTLFAFFGGILLILLMLGTWFLFSSFGNKPEKPIENVPIVPSIRPIELRPKVEPLKPKVPHVETATPTTANKFKKYAPSKTPVEVEVPKTTTPNETPTASGNGTETGPAVTSPTDGGGTAITVTIPDKGPVTTAELDRLPEYPGGIKKFYEYVGTNFEKPEVDENLESIRIIMSFVIEKDGEMSNIRVLRSPDRKLETEAIRVLKSLKVKWSPGYKNGDKMRTLYTLPIRITL